MANTKQPGNRQDQHRDNRPGKQASGKQQQDQGRNMQGQGRNQQQDQSSGRSDDNSRGESSRNR